MRLFFSDARQLAVYSANYYCCKRDRRTQSRIFAISASDGSIYSNMLCLDMSKTFLLCVALAIGPPIAIVAHITISGLPDGRSIRASPPARYCFSKPTGAALAAACSRWSSNFAAKVLVFARLMSTHIRSRQAITTSIPFPPSCSYATAKKCAAALALFRLNRSASFGGKQASSAEYILHFRRAKSRA